MSSNKILVKVEVLIEKLNLLYEDITKKGGEFSDIDRELLISYSRELYESTQRLKISGDKLLRTSFQFFDEDSTKEVKSMPTPQVPNVEKGDNLQAGAAKKTLSEIYHSESVSINEKFKGTSRLIGDTASHAPIKNLKTYIGLNKQFIFISRLFNDNSGEYNHAIDVCNASPNEEEAFKFLNDNFTNKYNWKNEVELVNELCTFVHRRFL